MTIGVIDQAAAPACLDLAARVFAAGSTLHRACGIEAPEYKDLLRDGFLHNVAQGLSVMARDKTGVLGCVVACDLLDQGSGPTDPRLVPLQVLLHELEKKYIELQSPTPGQTILIDMAFVRPDQTGRGLYQRLRAATHGLAKSRGYRRVIGLLSSAATQHVVVTRLGHRVMARVAFAGFDHDGTCPFAKITDPQEIWLTEGRLDP